MGPYCKFCNSRCFVHFPEHTPAHILRAYGTATIVATCPAGQRFEKEKVGYCYDEILQAAKDSGVSIQAPADILVCHCGHELLRHSDGGCTVVVNADLKKLCPCLVPMMAPHMRLLDEIASLRTAKTAHAKS